MPKTQKLKSPQETTTGSSDVKANDTIPCPVQQKISNDIHTAESSEYESNDNLEQNTSSLEQLKNALQNQDLEDISFLNEELRNAKLQIFYKDMSLTIFDRLLQFHSDQLLQCKAQLATSDSYAQKLSQEIKSLTDERDELSETISMQEQKIENLNHQNVQLGEERDLTLAQRVEQEDELQRTKAQLERKEGELNRAQQNLARLQENEDENTKLPVASDQSRKQSNYASAAFVIAGVFAVGASLTIPYLAICLTLAVAASIFLIAGGCCLYKANTALSDVKADQIASVVGALNNF
nr:hypothetical protein [Rickettsia endosymbiont of Ceutorhynchus assimilis]